MQTPMWLTFTIWYFMAMYAEVAFPFTVISTFVNEGGVCRKAWDSSSRTTLVPWIKRNGKKWYSYGSISGESIYSDLLVSRTEFRRDCVLFSEIPPLSQMSGKGRRCLNHSKIMQGTALLVPRVAFELDILYQRESFVYGHFVFISNSYIFSTHPRFNFGAQLGDFEGDLCLIFS